MTDTIVFWPGITGPIPIKAVGNGDGTYALAMQGITGGTALPVDTELPAAALLADGAALPTAPTMGSVGLLYDGSVTRLAKGTARGATLNAPDYRAIYLDAAAPNPAGNDIMVSQAGAAPTNADFSIRDTTPHRFFVPVLAGGWRTVSTWIRFSAAFDQQATINTYRISYYAPAAVSFSGSGQGATVAAGLTPTIEIAGGTALANFAGALTGGSYNSVMAASVFVFVIHVAFAIAPTAGAIQLYVERAS